MVKFLERAYAEVTSTGTGDIVIGAAVDGFRDFASAGALDGDEIVYGLEEGADWEVGVGTYTAATDTISRSVRISSNGGSPINLQGDAKIFGTVSAQDIRPTIPVAMVSNVDDWTATDDEVVPFQTAYTLRGGMQFSETADLGGTGETGSAIIIPEDGVYEVSVALGWSVLTESIGDGILFEIQTDGLGTDSIPDNETRIFSSFGSAAGEEKSVSTTVIVELQANDTVYVRVTSVGSSSAEIDYGSFCIHKID